MNSQLLFLRERHSQRKLWVIHSKQNKLRWSSSHAYLLVQGWSCCRKGAGHRQILRCVPIQVSNFWCWNYHHYPITVWGNEPLPRSMNFDCNKRVSWMMSSYGISEQVAKESVINSCHFRRIRGWDRREKLPKIISINADLKTYSSYFFWIWVWLAILFM